MPDEELIDKQFMDRLAQLTLTARKIFRGKIKGERLSRKRGQSIEFADYRNYVVGDDLRFIDWNIYGRLDRLFLKLFLEEEDLFVYILIDTSESMSYGAPSKLLYAKRIAAALGYIGLANLDRVVLSAFSSGIGSALTPGRGKRQARKLFGYLETLTCDGETSLENSIRLFTARHRQPGMVIVLSDFLDPAGFESALKRLRGRNMDIYAFHILADEEVDPPLVGDLRLVDAEDGSQVEITMSGPMIKGYKNAVQNFCDDLNRFCTKSGMSYVFSKSSDPFDRLILNYLRRRGLVK
ncbi:MAG: DUF58 domain-containing protein [Planctomycetota bacterium]